MAFDPSTSRLWAVAPALAARLTADELAAIEAALRKAPAPPDGALDLLRRLRCPTVTRPLRETA